MNSWMNKWMNAWINEWMNEWMHEFMNAWMHKWIIPESVVSWKAMVPASLNISGHQISSKLKKNHEKRDE